MPNIIQRVKAGVKAFWGGGDWVSGNIPGNRYSSSRLTDWSPGTNLNYGLLAGDLWQNSACQAVLNKVITSWPESYPCVKIMDKSGKKVIQPEHPLTQLLLNPNAFDDDTALWGGTIISYWCDGNAYWRINRTRGGAIGEFEYVPHWAIQPRRNEGSTNPGPDFYLLNIAGKQVPIQPYDIVHYRFGKDPYNDMLGMSPWRSVSEDVYTDNEALNYSCSTLRNRGAAWLIVSPEGDVQFDDATQVRDLIEARTTGDNRNRVVVMEVPSKLTFPPAMKDQNLDGLRKMSETRIAALAGFPAIWVGFAAGLDHCLPAFTRISTVEDGPIPISDVKPGHHVWSLGKDGIAPSLVTWSGNTGVRKVYRVRTKNRTIFATDNHPFLVRCQYKVPAPKINKRFSPEWKYELEWRELRALKAGDYIVSAVSLPDIGNTQLPTGETATVDLMEWLGAFVGDGCYRGGARDEGLTLCIPQSDRVRQHYEELTRRLFSRYAGGGIRPWKLAKDGMTPEIVARYQSGETYSQIAKDLGISKSKVYDRVKNALDCKTIRTAPITICQSRNGFTFASAMGSRWIRSLGIKRGARNKDIPAWVFGLTEELRLSFLRGLLDTDGTVDNRGHASFKFASEKLTSDIRDLAISLGMNVSNILKGKVGPECYRKMHVANVSQDYFDHWSVKLTSHEDVERIGTYDAKYQEYLANATEKKQRPSWGRQGNQGIPPPDGCAFVAIQSIDYVEDMEVYDLTVEGTHNFVAEGLIVHNSTMHNTAEAATAAWLTIVAIQRMMGRQLTKQVLWRQENYNQPVNTVFAGFDYSEVRALQPDKTIEDANVRENFAVGLLTEDEARVEIGKEPFTAAQKADQQARAQAEAALKPIHILQPNQPTQAENSTSPGKPGKTDLLLAIAAKASERKDYYDQLFDWQEETDRTSEKTDTERDDSANPPPSEKNGHDNSGLLIGSADGG